MSQTIILNIPVHLVERFRDALVSICSAYAETLSHELNGHLQDKAQQSSRTLRRRLERMKAAIVLIDQVGLTTPGDSRPLTVCGDTALLLETVEGALVSATNDIDPDELRERARYADWLSDLKATIEREHQDTDRV